jgi:hypothetical protein
MRSPTYRSAKLVGIAVPVAQSVDRLFEHTSVMETVNLDFAEWPNVLGDTKMICSRLNHIARRCHIVETSRESIHT